ncbi:helix-turn-helix domain-containing protein [Calidifontibacillus erzurumensis]|uniref:helix-turn-helix domain-containing protein n=1 Tax=Calidifontibacillus erzurumensis TaxID=2741433 RepID=UPI0018AD3873|nr:helix-turn-helix domain-containing protein [Calidifontibacillus erzurumensis]
MSVDFEKQLRDLIYKATQDAIKQLKNNEEKQWLSLKEGAQYAGVSYNTFLKFRDLGLKICEIDGVKRVNKKSIDEFLEKFSY